LLDKLQHHPYVNKRKEINYFISDVAAAYRKS